MGKTVHSLMRRERKTKIQAIVRNCGYWPAARYLCKRGYSFDAAYWLIFGKLPRI